MNKKEIKNLEELKQVSFDLVKGFKLPQLVLLKGDLAVGKTQMVQYMIQALGFKKETIHSPTFSFINCYQEDSKKRIYHVDLYRIKQDQELEDIAFWDIFYEARVIFIEWSERLGKQLPILWNKLFIQMEFSKKNDARIIKWERKVF